MIRVCAVLVAVAACNAEPVADTRAQAIVGGTVDTGDDAVVAIGHRARSCGEAPRATCTGTLIAPRAVLTAAHCVANESPASLVLITGPRADGGERVEIETIESHPDYDGVAPDFAVIELVDPLATPPVPLRRTAIDASAVGGPARVVGYGVDEGGVTSTKRQGMARVSAVEATSLVLAPDPALPCNGDSGGPVLLAEELAGVVSYGDPTCTVSNTSGRVDLQLAAFIEPALARIAANAPPSRPALGVTCSACEQTDDCPRGTECLDGSCVLAASEGRGLGATCSDDQTCGDSPCLAGLDEAACHCLESCEPDGCGCRTHDGSSGALIVLMIVVFARRQRREA